ALGVALQDLAHGLQAPVGVAALAEERRVAEARAEVVRILGEDRLVVGARVTELAHAARGLGAGQAGGLLRPGELDGLAQRRDGAAVVAHAPAGDAEVVPGLPQRRIGGDGALEALGGALVGLGTAELDGAEPGVEVAEARRLCGRILLRRLALRGRSRRRFVGLRVRLCMSAASRE